MTKYSVSITAETKARLKKRSDETGQSMASIVEEATKDCVVPIVVDDASFDAFTAAIANPPTPTTALRDLLHSSNPDTSPAPISSSSSWDTAST